MQPPAPTFVKITLGIGDATGRDWSGSVHVDGGTLVDMRPWAFETRHELDAARHRWVCDSAVKVARGRTRFAEPQRGVVLGVQGPPSSRLSVQTEQGSFTCLLSDLRLGTTMPVLNGAASVEQTMTPREAAATEGEEDYPALAVDADNRLWVAWVSWERGADVIYARSRDGEAWSKPLALAGPGDFYQVKLAREGRGRLWLVWAAQQKGNWDLYARVYDRGAWGPARQLTTTPGSDFKHDLAADAGGNLWLAWQSLGGGSADIFLRNLSDPDAETLCVTNHPADDWEPALACDGKGNVYVAWDTYRNGNYDIYLRRMAPEPGEPIAVAASPEFEAHASAACDRDDRVWVAYDSAQPNWGKDYTRDETLHDGNFTATLHAYRRLQLRCVTPGGVRAAPAPVPQVLSDDRTSAGYKRSIWAALERGHRLGFIASSDHWSTHLSYACVYAEELTRESIFRAIQRRRTYAAMDKIIVEFSINGHPMGEQFETTGPVELRAKVLGTAKLSKIEVVKNNRFIYTIEPAKREHEFTYRDVAAAPGTSYYYLRVSQENKLPDGSPIMAWSSPVWVRVAEPRR